MKAVTFAGIRQVETDTVPDPTVQDPGDVVVKTRLTAVCGSDLHVFHGREQGLDHGTVMGHEFVGEIVDCGAEVPGLSRGDLVLCPFTTSCGECFYCRSGLSARCEKGEFFGWVENGQGLHGAQAEYVRVPLAESTLVRVPPDFTLESALLMSDVFTTGYYCADQADVAGRTCVVIGCGPVGLMAIIAAGQLGAERIFALDPVPERLAHARRLGAETVTDDPVGAIRDATQGRGACAVLEVVGSPEASRLALELCRPGGTISAVGVHTEKSFAFSPAEAYDHNLTFRAGRCPVRSYLDRLLPIAGSLPLDSIITHRMPLEQGPEAYALFDARTDGAVKVLLEP